MAEGRSSGHDPLLGTTVAGRYRIVSLIARGGMGKVYRAEQSALGRICALKVLVPGDQADKDPEFYKRFSREASTAAKLNHANSVTIFDYGKDDDLGLYFIAMEYLDGKTLHRVLHDEGALPEERVSKIAQQICRALAEAHSVGLVHRDLKPSNILLINHGDELDFVKVLDFGLVKDVTAQGDDLTQTGLFMGSPKYTAPEQVMGADLTGRADIYSLGVVLYEMLCGRAPFDKKVSTATLMAHVNEAPPPMAEHVPGALVSEAMEAIVMKCLEKSPEHRFASMKEVFRALRVASGEAVDDAARSSLPSLPGRISVPPSPTGSGPRPVPSTTPLDDSLAPPQAPATLTSAPMPKRRSPLSTYIVAAIAALGGGALVLALGRDKPQALAPTKVESVIVPIAVPAGTVSPAEANPAAGLRLVRIESDPPGSRVTDRGTEVCLATPCQILLRGEGVHASYQLELTQAGFKTAMLEVGPDDETASITLEPVETHSIGSPAPAAEATEEPTPTPAPEETSAPEPQAPEPPPAPVEVAQTAPPPTATAPAAPEPTQTHAPPSVLPFSAGMTRPSPISAPNPIYTREARAAKTGGTVIAKCIIMASGSVTGCRIIKGVRYMNDAVLSALLASRYRPATLHGRPVNVDYVITLKLVPP